MGEAAQGEPIMKVYLGGTANGSNWRERLVPQLMMEYFNPIVPRWTEKAYQHELHEREECDVCLYVITPKFEGLYSIAEVVDDSNKRPEKTVFCILDDEDESFTPHQLKSLQRIGEMVTKNGALYCEGMENLVQLLNAKVERG
jgi:hypothetical protein